MTKMREKEYEHSVCDGVPRAEEVLFYNTDIQSQWEDNNLITYTGSRGYYFYSEVCKHKT